MHWYVLKHLIFLVALDALLNSGNDWEKLCLTGILHGGDNDSTGTICCAWFGAIYGFQNVFKSNYEGIEYRERMDDLGRQLFAICEKEGIPELK